jgi:predicted HTH transcriptional regulator
MNTRKLITLLKKEEGTKLDFKLKIDLFTESGKKEFSKDVSAIANSKGGRGYLIIGIEDKSKEIIGIKDENLFEEERVQQVISSRCEPPIPIEVEFQELEGKKIGIIIIYDGNQKPYQVKETGAFYIRRGSTTDIMRKQEILNCFEENLDISIETCPIIKSDTSLLDMKLIKKYFSNKNIDINEDNKSYLLENAGIVFTEKESKEQSCTYGGLIVFSEENSLCIPNNMIKVINKLDDKMQKITIIQGSLLTMIDRVDKLLNSILPKGYPIVAINEAIKNAVLYRDYTEMERVIEVMISRKSVVIESPGARIIKNSLGKNEEYIRRNMWIYEKLMTLDKNKIFSTDGRGFNIMKNSFKSKTKQRVKFTNSKTENSFKVILPGVFVE